MNSNMANSLKKYITKDKLILFILFGVLLIVIAIPHDKDNETVSDDGSTDARLESILSQIEGVGDCRVIINYASKKDKVYDTETEVVGVLIVAKGAGKPAVAEKIMSSVKALLGISANKIVIMKMEE